VLTERAAQSRFTSERCNSGTPRNGSTTSASISTTKLIAEAEALESTLLHGGTRIGAAVWIILVSAIAGAFSGFTFGDEVRSSSLIFISYLIAGALLLRALKPLSTRLLGPPVAWQAVVAFFWSFLLAMVAV
jgi:hypothetical protein